MEFERSESADLCRSEEKYDDGGAFFDVNGR